MCDKSPETCLAAAPLRQHRARIRLWISNQKSPRDSVDFQDAPAISQTMKSRRKSLTTHLRFAPESKVSALPLRIRKHSFRAPFRACFWSGKSLRHVLWSLPLNLRMLALVWDRKLARIRLELVRFRSFESAVNWYQSIRENQTARAIQNSAFPQPVFTPDLHPFSTRILS